MARIKLRDINKLVLLARPSRFTNYSPYRYQFHRLNPASRNRCYIRQGAARRYDYNIFGCIYGIGCRKCWLEFNRMKRSVWRASRVTPRRPNAGTSDRVALEARIRKIANTKLPFTVITVTLFIGVNVFGPVPVAGVRTP